jgi:hypothetical protein
MNVFKFRVLVDSTDDVFRDIEILPSQTLQDLYDTILIAFEFNGGVMASFYASNDEWERGQEYNLLDMSEKGNDKNVMSKVVLNDIVEEENQKLLLVHDFMRMWCFYVELIEEKPAVKGVDYPRVVMKFGESPDETAKEITDLGAFGGDTAFNANEDLDFGDENDLDEDDNDEIGDMFDELGSHSENDDH